MADSKVLAVLDLVSRRLSDPRRWVQGTYAGVRGRDGKIVPFYQHGKLSDATCWCLGSAITMAVSDVLPADANGYAWLELRSEVERELLEGLEAATGAQFPALYQWNDDLKTSFADVQALVVGTWLGLVAEAA